MKIASPRIGVTWCGDLGKQGLYERAIAEAGGEPRLIHPEDAGTMTTDVAVLDGLLLTGGDDVDPRWYGQILRTDEGLHERVEVDAARDALEIPLARAALAAELPLLAICRGIQVLNVAAGGALVQDTSLLGLPADAHDQTRRRPILATGAPAHGVRLRGGSRVAAIGAAPAIGVNSFHHQALGRIADGFEVTAIAPDGVVEAIEHRANAFVVGVQWHPERMTEKHAAQRRLFAALVEAASRAPQRSS